MARKKLGDRNIRKIQRMGSGSYIVTLPIEMMRELKWRERQKVVVRKKGNTLVISDWKPKS